MKKALLSAFLLSATALTASAQPYPIDDYDEPRLEENWSSAPWQALSEGLHASWASRDALYQLHQVPELAETTAATLHAWQGERANIEAVLFSKTNQGNLTLSFSKWKKDGKATDIAAGEARFLNYVITDDDKACGNHDFDLIPWLVPDVIDQAKPHAVPAMETRPVWCSIEVPRGIEAGHYSTTLDIKDESGKLVKQLDLNIVVNAHELPAVKDQVFHLDFWQQPYAVSRYYGVERWSEAHIAALRPYLEALGKAGQDVVSTIMFYEPWGEQSHDKFDPMVKTVKKADGTWAYDYTVFDRYVELCAEYGIDKQISCYSMVPWDMKFRYFDEAEGKDVDLTVTTSTSEYKELWTQFLQSFRTHLEAKGWFDKTLIAMDERSESDMLNAYDIAHAQGFKMALAGNYHSSLYNKLDDFCVAPTQEKFTEAELQYRKDHHMVTTIYTCCAEPEPNIFSNSLPAEAAYLPLHVAAINYDGYLHWAWINWDEHPLSDSRFRMFGAGDTYCYYPGNRSSVRFERLVEGIHQFEKIQVLKREFKDNAEKLAQLNALLKGFEEYGVASEECAALVNGMEQFLNEQ